MPNSVACPSCGKKLKVPEGVTAARARCPGCGKVVSLTAPVAITAAAPPKRPPEAREQRPEPEPEVEEGIQEAPDEDVPEVTAADEVPRAQKKKRKRRKKEKKPAPAFPLWLWGVVAGAVLLLGGLISAVFIHAGYGLHLLAFAIGMAIIIPVSVVILVLSMFAASAVLGGVDFGEAHVAIPKAAALLFVVNLIQMIPFAGPYIALPVWFLGLMGLFGLDWVEARVLVAINWGLNFVFRMFVLSVIVSALMHGRGDGDHPRRGSSPKDDPAAVEMDDDDAPPVRMPMRPGGMPVPPGDFRP